MKTFLFIVALAILISFNTKPANNCVKVTCLNQKDTVSETLGEYKSYFLVESLGDTLSNFDIRPSCGCEIAIWKKGMKVYPNHPDTVIIISSLKDHAGRWIKMTTLSANNCTQLFYTGPWIVTKE